jgi:hypothetical protein
VPQHSGSWADGSLEAIEAELGTRLGLGSTSILISPDDLR